MKFQLWFFKFTLGWSVYDRNPGQDDPGKHSAVQIDVIEEEGLSFTKYLIKEADAQLKEIRYVCKTGSIFIPHQLIIIFIVVIMYLLLQLPAVSLSIWKQIVFALLNFVLTEWSVIDFYVLFFPLFRQKAEMSSGLAVDYICQITNVWTQNIRCFHQTFSIISPCPFSSSSSSYNNNNSDNNNNKIYTTGQQVLDPQESFYQTNYIFLL